MKTLTLTIKDIALIKNNPKEYYESYAIKSYSHKPHLAVLPYDHNTKNELKMCARYYACDQLEKQVKKDVDDLNEKFEKHIKDYMQHTGEQVKAEFEVEKAERHLDDMQDEERQSREQKAQTERDLTNKLFGDDGFITESLKVKYETEDSYDFEKMDTEQDKVLHDFLDGTIFLHDGNECYPECQTDIDKVIDYLENDIEYDPTLTTSEVRELDTEKRDLINSLNSLKDNTATDNTAKANQELDDAEEKLYLVQSELEWDKRRITETKADLHNNNVKLYDIANEKQNCADVWDDAVGISFPDSIDEYIYETVGEKSFKEQLNSDGTFKQDFLNQMQEVAEDNGFPWYE